MAKFWNGKIISWEQAGHKESQSNWGGCWARPTPTTLLLGEFNVYQEGFSWRSRDPQVPCENSAYRSWDLSWRSWTPNEQHIVWVCLYKDKQIRHVWTHYISYEQRHLFIFRKSEDFRFLFVSSPCFRALRKSGQPAHPFSSVSPALGL